MGDFQPYVISSVQVNPRPHSREIDILQRVRETCPCAEPNIIVKVLYREMGSSTNIASYSHITKVSGQPSISSRTSTIKYDRAVMPGILAYRDCHRTSGSTRGWSSQNAAVRLRG